MYKVVKDGFIQDCKNELKTYIEIGSKTTNDEWVLKQTASLDEYKDHASHIPHNIKVLYDLFDGYIAKAIGGKKDINILDIGCGIRSEWPHYARTIKEYQTLTNNVYIGLDPLPINTDGREYPLIVGRLEDVKNQLISSFDVFIFSTSLDHFENISDAMNAVKKIANPNSILIIWSGLHDPALVAEQAGADNFRKLYTSLNPIIFIFRFTKTIISILFNYARLLKRRLYLLKNKSLDKFHFHYFTERSIHAEMKAFGVVESYLQIPGTNSVFMVVRLKS